MYYTCNIPTCQHLAIADAKLRVGYLILLQLHPIKDLFPRFSPGDGEQTSSYWDFTSLFDALVRADEPREDEHPEHEELEDDF